MLEYFWSRIGFVKNIALEEIHVYRGAILFISAYVAAFFCYGFILSMYWRWFVFPVFVGIPNLSMVPAGGIAVVIHCLADHRSVTGRMNRDLDVDDDLLSSVKVIFLRSVCVLFFGWIWHFFM